MKKIEAIIRHDTLQEVQDALDEVGVSGLTVTEVKGCGSTPPYTETYRGQSAHISLRPKLKIEIACPLDIADAAVQAILEKAHTGEVGDGIVMVYPLEACWKISTKSGGEDAVRHATPAHWGH
ncbi:MAG: P-II family nitrogen regulator [Candidatus Dormibacteria bacterium]